MTEARTINDVHHVALPISHGATVRDCAFFYCSGISVVVRVV